MLTSLVKRTKTKFRQWPEFQGHSWNNQGQFFTSSASMCSSWLCRSGPSFVTWYTDMICQQTCLRAYSSGHLGMASCRYWYFWTWMLFRTKRRPILIKSNIKYSLTVALYTYTGKWESSNANVISATDDRLNFQHIWYEDQLFTYTMGTVHR